MRALIIFAGVSLALTACGKNDQGNTAQNNNEGMNAGTIVANDVTAIDAVTGDAANMAADVNYEGLDAVDANGAADNTSNPAKPHSSSPRPAKSKVAQPVSNSASDSTNAD